MKPARFDVEAIAEVEEAARWYEERRVGLGVECVQEIRSSIRRLCRLPASFPSIPGLPEDLAVRRALVRRFPYALVFVELPVEIRLIALAHLRRQPGYWLDRIR